MIGPKVEKVDIYREMIDFIFKGLNIKKPVLAPTFINSVRRDIIFKNLAFFLNTNIKFREFYQ